MLLWSGFSLRRLPSYLWLFWLIDSDGGDRPGDSRLCQDFLGHKLSGAGSPCSGGDDDGGSRGPHLPAVRDRYGLGGSGFHGVVVVQDASGQIVRAAVSDRDMVNALGINIPVVFMFVFGIGTWLAGIAGVQLTHSDGLPGLGGSGGHATR